jgi:hypothetical protein
MQAPREARSGMKGRNIFQLAVVCGTALVASSLTLTAEAQAPIVPAPAASASSSAAPVDSAPSAAPPAPTPAEAVPSGAAPSAQPEPSPAPSASPAPPAPARAPSVPQEGREPTSSNLAVAAPPLPSPPTLTPSAPSGDKANKTDDDPARRPVTHRFRKGFMLTLVLSGGVGQGSGYPNDVQKIGLPQYFSRTPVMPGQGFHLVIGGALTDYFDFGVVFGGTGFENDQWRMTSSTFGFRIEAFPGVLAFPNVKALANLGIGGDLGAGMMKIQAKGNFPTVDGFQSSLGIGAFYDFRLFGLLGGHVSLAPEISYHAAYASAAQVNYGALSARLSFFGGP